MKQYEAVLDMKEATLQVMGRKLQLQPRESPEAGRRRMAGTGLEMAHLDPITSRGITGSALTQSQPFCRMIRARRRGEDSSEDEVEMRRNREVKRRNEAKTTLGEIGTTGTYVIISPAEGHADAIGSQGKRVASKIAAEADEEKKVMAGRGNSSPAIRLGEVDATEAARQSLTRRTGQRVEQESAVPPRWRNKRGKRRGCFHCGSWRHQIRHCPQRQLERQGNGGGEVTSTGMGATGTTNLDAKREDSMSSDELFEGMAIPETPPWMLGRSTGTTGGEEEARGGSPDSVAST